MLLVTGYIFFQSMPSLGLPAVCCPAVARLPPLPRLHQATDWTALTRSQVVIKHLLVISSSRMRGASRLYGLNTGWLWACHQCSLVATRYLSQHQDLHQRLPAAKAGSVTPYRIVLCASACPKYSARELAHVASASQLFTVSTPLQS